MYYSSMSWDPIYNRIYKLIKYEMTVFAEVYILFHFNIITSVKLEQP